MKWTEKPLRAVFYGRVGSAHQLDAGKKMVLLRMQCCADHAKQSEFQIVDWQFFTHNNYELGPPTHLERPAQ